ncbi:MAG: flagellar motor protein MotB, partial [Alphaproteobacteria bacterium]
MAEIANAPLIIKKIKKGGHSAHHGGAWKVAYADFVTAMMAFFLLLWLLNTTTDKQKKGIAEYFSPVHGTVGESSGGDGFFKGNSVTAEGKMVTDTAPVTVSIPIPTTSVTEKSDEGESDKLREAPKDTEADSESSDATSGGKKQDQQMNENQAAQVLADAEEKQFNEAEHLLRQAIQDVPDLKDLAENLIIEQTPEGLRIQIVDQDRMSMFPRGSIVMHDKARLLMHKVAEVIKKMPQKITITGHTDATPYANAGGYDNWDLSTDRANASRRALIEAGLSPERIANMTGRADQEPLVKDDPTSAKNRRISIVLLREARAGAAGAAGASQGAEPKQGSEATPPPQGQPDSNMGRAAQAAPGAENQATPPAENQAETQATSQVATQAPAGVPPQAASQTTPRAAPKATPQATPQPTPQIAPQS